MRKALEGVRILDMGRFIGAPWAGALLAVMGAEVIRIEKPGGENDRILGFTALDGQGMTFHATNVNKKCITLDIRKEKGRDVFHRLVKVSDVIMENFSPAGADYMGISYDTLKAVKPDIIYVSATGFGRNSPYVNRLAYDPVGKAMCGSMSITGFPGNPPTRDGAPWVDYMLATNAAVGTLTALYHHEKTGEGQMVEVGMLDSALAVACRVFMDYMARGTVRPQMGNQSPGASQNVYKTKDGWMLIASIQEVWKRFCKLIGREDLLKDPRFTTDALRFENREALDPIIQEWVGNKTNEELARLFEPVRVPFGPVYYGQQIVADPHFRAREMIVELDYPGGKIPGKKIAVPGVPIKLSKTPGKVETPAPLLGQHNEDIYCDLLGYTKQELAELINEGVV